MLGIQKKKRKMFVSSDEGKLSDREQQQPQETGKFWGTWQAALSHKQASPAPGPGLGSPEPASNCAWRDSRAWEQPPSPNFPSLFWGEAGVWRVNIFIKSLA